MRRESLACLACWLFACVGDLDASDPLQVGPMDAFESQVQPVIAERCGSGGCHGRPERPLSLYVPGAQRLDPARVYLDEPLSAEELERNARRIAAFAHAVAPEQSLVLCKPLSQQASGCWHGAHDVFGDANDPGYQTLLDWLRARDEPADGGP